MNQTGDVAGYAKPLRFDSKHKNKPCFDLDDDEFNNLITRNKIPDRVSGYAKSTNDDKIFMKNKKGNVTINYAKIKRMLGL
jgi:hypothetical protein